LPSGVLTYYPTRRSADLEGVVLVGDIGEEDVGRLPAELQRDGYQVLRRVLHDQAPGGRLAGERDLRNAVARCQRFARFDAKAVRSEEHTSELQSRFDLVC